MRSIRRAIISVYDKTGVVELAKGLESLNVELISTGGTAKMLRNAGIKVKDISEITGFPEILDGRVKTLHPVVHAGILAIRENEEHMKILKEQNIGLIDMVVVNLYPFEEVLKKGAPHADIIENIDIGGPTMLRAAAKNYNDVAVIVDPLDYDKVLNEMRMNKNQLSDETRLHLAQKVFSRTASYDSIINSYFLKYLKKKGLHDRLIISLQKVRDLRYGENPHQSAALYVNANENRRSLASVSPLQGKELSYNNIIDAEAARSLVFEFVEPAVAIIKHTNPCGVAIGENILGAYIKALSVDPVSAFGGIIATNRQIDGASAEEMAKLFVEVIVAPEFSKEAIEIFGKKKNLRLIQLPPPSNEYEYCMKGIDGGMIIQSCDNTSSGEVRNAKIVTDRKPDEKEMRALDFAWKVAKHVKSNAIVFAKEDMALGIGAGQMSRIDSVKIAVMKAKHPLEGSVVASDAFFPFRDGIDEIAKAGATAVVQPGGSVRDDEVIKAANEHKMAMLFTGVRHFRH
jgi:phosphoribosylaminoimidazolecarboxamide formyltransferase/IMP cyclohydrolase